MVRLAARKLPDPQYPISKWRACAVPVLWCTAGQADGILYDNYYRLSMTIE